MRVLKKMAVFAAVVGAMPAGAQTQNGNMIEAAALGDCFVAKSTGEDRIALVRWFTAALLASPKTADVAHVDPVKTDQSQRQVASIFTRLMTKDCFSQARAVAKSGDPKAGFEIAGSALGKIAVKELLSDPAANAKISEFARYLSEDDFKALNAK